MENTNITNNLLIKQLNQSDAIAYNMDYVSKPVDTEFGVLNKAYKETGKEYATLKMKILMIRWKKNLLTKSLC